MVGQDLCLTNRLPHVIFRQASFDIVARRDFSCWSVRAGMDGKRVENAHSGDTLWVFVFRKGYFARDGWGYVVLVKSKRKASLAGPSPGCTREPRLDPKVQLFTQYRPLLGCCLKGPQRSDLGNRTVFILSKTV